MQPYLAGSSRKHEPKGVHRTAAASPLRALSLRPIGATVARQIPVLKVTRSNRVSVTDAVSDGTIPTQARAARASRSTSRAPPSTASSRTSCARAATSRAATVPRPRPMHIWGCSSVAERPLCMRKAQGSNPCSSTHTQLRGAMDSVSDFESGGCGFESRRSCLADAYNPHRRRTSSATCRASWTATPSRKARA